MDNEQFARKLDWLDEQRKKENESIERLRTHIGDLEASIAKLSKQMEDLSSEVSRLAASTAKVNQFDETISQHRIEISRQLKDAEKRRTKKEQQLESLRKSDQNKIVKSIDDIRQELERLGSIEEQLDQRAKEHNRLNREHGDLTERVNELDARVDERTVRIVSLEESNTQDTKRINQTLSDVTALKRTADDLRNSIELIDDRTRKMEVSVSELKSSNEERTSQLEVWIDEQRMRLVDFEQKWSAWDKRFQAFEADAHEIEGKIAAYDQTHRAIKQMQSQLEGLLERLERRITEVSEMQRLSDERMKQDWVSFEADESKKWSTFKLSSEERWKEHLRLHDRLGGSLEELIDLRGQMREDLDMLLEREARIASEFLELTRRWLKEQE